MYYGFDMGGTKIELAVFDLQLNKLWSKRAPTPRDDYQALLTVFKTLTDEADAQFGTQNKIGIGVPGIPNTATGEVYTTNIPAAKNQPLFNDLEKCLGRAIRIDNDANCFALSEAWDETFRQYKSVLGIILGTGLGGGFVINGQPVSGLNGISGEIGHLRLTVDGLAILGADIPLVPCGCGHNGCYEGYLSGRGFEWLYHHFYQQPLSAITIIQHYREQHPSAIKHVKRYVELLAVYLGNILTLFDPELVVLGGGLSNFDELYYLLPKALPNYLYPIAKLPRFEKARHGDAGGTRGAAFLNITE